MNVVFRGPRPVFVDALSSERQRPGDATWRAEAQFVRTFLLPLLLARRTGRTLQDTFLASAEGVEPERAYAALGWGGRLRPPALGLATMPTLLTSRAEQTSDLYRSRDVSPERARYVHDALVRRSRRALDALAGAAATPSAWRAYPQQHAASYTDDKVVRVREVLEDLRPTAVLDRLRGEFDAVLALALVHHLIVTARAPLSEVFALLADLTTDVAIVEYIDPSDEFFTRVARGREGLHADLTSEQFTSCAAQYFRVEREIPLAHPSRRLFVFRRRF